MNYNIQDRQDGIIKNSSTTVRFDYNGSTYEFTMSHFNWLEESDIENNIQVRISNMIQSEDLELYNINNNI